MTLHAKSRMHDLQRYPSNVYLRPRVTVHLRPRVFIWDRGCLSGITHIPRNSRTYIFNFCDKESNIYIFRYKSTMCSTLTRVSGNNLKGSLSLNNQRFKRYSEPNTLFYKWGSRDLHWIKYVDIYKDRLLL